jgi:hypothetical protein
LVSGLLHFFLDIDRYDKKKIIGSL